MLAVNCTDTTNCVLMCPLLLLFGSNLRNAWLRFGQSHSHVIFTSKPAPFLRFNLHHLFWESLLIEIWSGKPCWYFKSNFSNVRIFFNLAALKSWQCCCIKDHLFNVALLKFYKISQVWITHLCCCNINAERLPYPCWWLLDITKA